MVSAVVLLKCERNKINSVAETLAGISGISEVFSVAGVYDLVAILRVRNNDALADLVTSEMLQVDGIVDS
ncbi:MAG TPA: AsnC family transcriptional regulator, partial [Chloroflexi bacterium]|nr:AsnC family transcriptional regulator [Chloroflexota bacterium]